MWLRGQPAVGPGAVGGEQDADPVVGEVAEAVGEEAGLLDDAVDGLGAGVGDASGGEVGQQLLPPGAQGPAEAGELGDGAGRQRREQLLGPLATSDRGGGVVVDLADALVDAPGELDLGVGVTCRQVGVQPCGLPWGGVLDAGERGRRIR